MSFWGVRPCCCVGVSQPPTGVETPCSDSIDSCLIGSTDGEGVSVDSNPFGGSASLSSDPDWGRPGPGIKIEATQSGDDGCFTVLKIDDPLPYFFNCGEVMICGEFTKATPGDSLRIWPCIFDGSDVYVLSATPTVVSSKTTWKGVSATFNLGSSSTDGLFVTGYNADGVTTSTDRIPSHVEIHAGFIVQSIGDDAEVFPFYLDNVCAWQDHNCPSTSCQVVTVTLSDFSTSGDYTSLFDSDCWVQAAEHSLIQGAINGSFLLALTNYISAPDPNPKTQQWLNGGGISGTPVYDDGTDRVYLDLTVGIPVNGSGAIFLGQWMVLSMRVIHHNVNCGNGPLVIGDWAYRLTSDDFECGVPLEFEFLSESMGGLSAFSSVYPETVTVIFQDA